MISSIIGVAWGCAMIAVTNGLLHIGVSTVNANALSCGMLTITCCFMMIFKDRSFINKVPAMFGGISACFSDVYKRQILDTVKEHFHLVADAEITVECNPGTLTAGKAEKLVQAGFNRLSMGLQSADDRELKLLGRIHNFAQFLESYDLARKAGFENINVDLMSALPGQTLKSWQDTLQKVTALRPEHISAYSLIIEEGTPFYERFAEDERIREEGGHPRLLPEEEVERQMYEVTERFLHTKGYERYEICLLYTSRCV